MDVTNIIGVGLIALIIIIILRQYRPEFTIYVSLISGVIIFFLVSNQLFGIINILQDFANKASINSKFLGILLKITGIALLTEFAVSVCKDAGENAIASKIDLGGKVIIISVSIPIISALLETVIKILP